MIKFNIIDKGGRHTQNTQIVRDRHLIKLRAFYFGSAVAWSTAIEWRARACVLQTAAATCADSRLRRGARSLCDIFSSVAKAFSEISTSRSPVSLLNLGQMMLVPVENATILKYNNRPRYE